MASQMSDEELRLQNRELEARIAQLQAAQQGGLPFVPRATRRGRGPRARGTNRFYPFSLRTIQTQPTFKNRLGHFATVRGGIATPPSRASSTPIEKIQELCPNFSSTGKIRVVALPGVYLFLEEGSDNILGSCALGARCRYIHDPDKTAICKTFLQKGSCPNGTACDLSHQLDTHRVPACSYFASGNCTNEKCRYAHIKQNPAAPICSSFAKLGYCEKGVECAELHRFECPDYANTGCCSNPGCKLPHVDRASNLRKRKEASKNGVIDSILLPDPNTDKATESDSEIDSDTEKKLVIPLSSDDQNLDAAEEQEYIRL